MLGPKLVVLFGKALSCELLEEVCHWADVESLRPHPAPSLLSALCLWFKV